MGGDVMTKRERDRVVGPIGDDFMARAIRRMHEAGIIGVEARDRMLERPMPEDPHVQIGVLRALLAIAIWRDDEPVAQCLEEGSWP